MSGVDNFPTFSDVNMTDKQLSYSRETARARRFQETAGKRRDWQSLSQGFLTSVSAAADRPASHGNQIISSTRPSCWIQMSTVMWSTLRPTIRCLWHWPANEVDSAWDDQPLTFTQKTKISLFEHLGVTYALYLWLVGKPVVDFILVVTELFSLSPTVETLWAEIGRSRRFSKGVGHFERRLQREGSLAHQPLLVSE